jgi:hypothetical protein
MKKSRLLLPENLSWIVVFLKRSWLSAHYFPIGESAKEPSIEGGKGVESAPIAICYPCLFDLNNTATDIVRDGCALQEAS